MDRESERGAIVVGKGAASPLDKIEGHAERLASGCWRWTGAMNGSGYPVARIDGKVRYVHRVVCEARCGPLEPREQVLRTCGHRWCVAPDHVTTRGRRQLEERFWDKAHRGPRDECWEWQAATHHARGYPVFWHGGQPASARLVAWYLVWGEWPDAGRYVVPECLNPVCVNPHAGHLMQCGAYDLMWYADEMKPGVDPAARLEALHREMSALDRRGEIEAEPQDMRAITGTWNEQEQQHKLRRLAPWRERLYWED